MSNPIIKIKHLNFTYYSSSREKVLDDLNLEVNENDFLAIVGPNGGGKSTLIKILTKQLPNYFGEIFINNQELKTFNYLDKIAYIPQKALHFNQEVPISTNEVIALGLVHINQTLSTKSSQSKINEIFQKLNINHLKNKLITKLSGGEQQKILIAKALISAPKILILDEPTIGLDELSKKSLLHFLKHLSTNKNLTVIMVDHDFKAMREISNKILVLDKTLQYFGPTPNLNNSNLKNNHSHH